MQNFKGNVELYKSCDPEGKKSIEAISKDLDWTRYKSYTFKYFISELSDEELVLLEKSTTELSYVVVNAICIQKKEYKGRLLENIDRINSADSPFDEIETLIKEIRGMDPLSMLANRYWVEVGEYLTARQIDTYPFNKNAINFIKNIGYKGYGSLSRPQQNWINGLLKSDKERDPGDRFFINQHLIQRGYQAECETIENYALCL